MAKKKTMEKEWTKTKEKEIHSSWLSNQTRSIFTNIYELVCVVCAHGSIPTVQDKCYVLFFKSDSVPMCKRKAIYVYETK